MKKDCSTMILVIIFLIGLAIFIYPTISSYYNEKVGSYAISQYNDNVKSISNEEVKSVLKNAQEYNSKLLSKSVKFVNGESSDSNYLSQLVIGDNNVMGSIEIEKIDVNLPIYHGTSEEVLQKGIGHLEGSSLPIGGLGNHSVLSGHRGLPSAKLFTNLDKLEVGDIIMINVCKRTMKYKVTEIVVVEPQDVERLKPEEGKDLLTLFTCTPYGVNSHRLLIKAERIANINLDSLTINNEKNDIDSMLIYSIILIAIGFTSIIVIKKIKNNKNKTGEV